MPTYDYRCEKCGDFEVNQKMSDATLTVCPTCGSAVQRLISAPAFHLKGSGWYKTDYASGSSSSPNETAKAKSTEGSTESSAESSTKSDSKSETGNSGSAASSSGDSAKTPQSD